MTFLQLCQRVCLECAIGDADGSEPTGVTNQIGELARVVAWVQTAWEEIQTASESWRWMRSRFSVNTVADIDTYAPDDCTDSRLSAPINRFSSWRVNDPRNPPRAYLTSGGVGGQYFLGYLSWDDFCATYRIGTLTTGMPVHITMDPQNNLVLGPIPDGVYTIVGEYQMAPQPLAADADEPEMPAQFHMLIVYDAMSKYAGYEVAQEVEARAVKYGGPLRYRLERNQLPAFRTGRPLVG